MVDTLVLGTSALVHAGSTPVTRTMFRFSDSDARLGFFICFFAAVTLAVAITAHYLTGQEWALYLGLLGTGWFFGASMVWLVGKMRSNRGK